MGHILVVDDEKSIRVTLSEFLKGEGHDVHSAEDAHIAFAMLEKNDFDVVVTDIILPQITGVDLLKTIRKYSPDVQVIMMTGEPTVETASKSLRAGAFDYLYKPISKDAIIKAVNNAARVKQLNDEKRRLEEENSRHRERLEHLVEEKTHSLRESEETARALLNSPSEAAMLMDVDGKMLALNNHMAERLGQSSEEIVGRCYYDYLSTDIAGNRRNKTAEVMRDGQPVFFQDERDGIMLDNRIYPVFDENGKVTRISFFSRDITDQIKLMNQLQQAQKMEALGTLAGGIAHDFNNILFPIVGYTEMSMDAVKPDDSIRNYLSEVLKAAHRAQGLVKQILSFSRQKEQERKPIQVKLILKEVLKLLRASLPSTIEIRVDAVSDSAIFADPVEIHQVMMNLFTNAYHAMREKGGVLTVALKDVDVTTDTDTDAQVLAPGHYIQMEVTDTGYGMGHSTIDRIFDPYFTTKELGEGTGLGLAMVHGIIASLNGHISVESELQKGTTFNIFFPQITQSADPAGEITSVPIPKGRGHILVVDDEEPICRMLEQVLRQIGYEVTSFTVSYEALSVFKNRPKKYDLLLTDMTMPGMTGMELSRQFIAIRPDIPVVLLSGYSDLTNEQLAKDAGVRSFIMKPVLRKELAEAIRSALAENYPD
jgi:PAS domain S-box-containing protein